jgi:hypothetical protein
LPRLAASYDDAALAADNANLLLQFWHHFSKAVGNVDRLYLSTMAAAAKQNKAVLKAIIKQ